MKKALRGLACAVVAAAVLGGGGGQAMAAHVACGDVITADTTLDSDLSCPDGGPRIGADGITLDLGGHSISGEGSGFVGVANASHDGVTIRGGTIRGFDEGVQLGPVTGNVVRDLTIVDSGLGVFLIDTDSSRVQANRIEDNHTGVWVYGSTGSADGNLVARNEMVGNSTAVDVTLGRDNAVRGNSVSGHFFAFFLSEVERTEVRRNDIFDPAFAGAWSLFMIYGSENLIERNRISGGRFGILLDSALSNNTIRSNRIRAAEFGIFMQVAVSSNLIAENHVLDSSKSGIVLSDDGFEGPSVGNSLVGNHVARSALDGILVQGEGAQGTLVEGNLARANGDDGIDVEAPGTTITANRASRNVDYGIEAIASVIDGGGNRARGNGNPAQCLNVPCR